MTNQLIIGCDEVGYGCGAGPLYVCGVRAPIDWKIDGLNDSKKLSPTKREKVFAKLILESKISNFTWFISIKTNQQIDQYGLGVMLKEAYNDVINKLYSENCNVIMDGTIKLNNSSIPQEKMQSIIKADTKIPSVMAASIIAKVSRDSLMNDLDKIHPNYNWKNNKGYLTGDHLDAIRKFGLSDLHRKSYKIKL